jgi:hypothetical protein
MFVQVVSGWLDGRPRRRPQGVNACLLIEDLGDVPSLDQYRNSQVLVFQRERAPGAVSGFWHIDDCMPFALSGKLFQPHLTDSRPFAAATGRGPAPTDLRVLVQPTGDE